MTDMGFVRLFKIGIPLHAQAARIHADDKKQSLALCMQRIAAYLPDG